MPVENGSTATVAGVHQASPSASGPPTGKPPRDLTYIKPRKRRLSEYEAVTCYAQPDPDAFDKEGWFLLTVEGRPAWRRESTRLQHPDWFSFRDPAGLWQRTYVRMQAEQERAIERATEDVAAAGGFGRIDPAWLRDIVAGHYRVWSYVEYGLFRAFAVAQREALSDTLGNVYCFEAFDRMRHAQAIVVHLLELEGQVEGFEDLGAKQRWLEHPQYQPLREVVEKLLHETDDWGELAVAVNLVFDPIVTQVLVSDLVGRFGPFHGDTVAPLVVGTTERDRRRNLAWTEELVRMVTADDVPAAEANRGVIQGWIDAWTPRAIAAAQFLEFLYDVPPLQIVRFEEALSTAVDAQRHAVEALGFRAAEDAEGTVRR